MTFDEYDWNSIRIRGISIRTVLDILHKLEASQMFGGLQADDSKARVYNEIIELLDNETNQDYSG